MLLLLCGALTGEYNINIIVSVVRMLVAGVAKLKMCHEFINVGSG